MKPYREVRAIREWEYLSELLQQTDGDLSLAARIAGVDRTTLYRMLQRHASGRQFLDVRRSLRGPRRGIPQ